MNTTVFLMIYGEDQHPSQPIYRPFTMRRSENGEIRLDFVRGKPIAIPAADYNELDRLDFIREVRVTRKSL